MTPVKIPKIIQWFFPSVLWKEKTEEKIVYLTFDDGPTPLVTEEVLIQLEKHKAKATFFCIGSRVESFPALYQSILEKGHSVGNHTHNHLKGLKTGNNIYFNDIEKAAEQITSTLFRPPYGKMKWSQFKELKKRYKIVLWDIIPGDFIASNSVERITNNILDNTTNGSIIVLHDSAKCASKMLKVLPLVLKELTQKGYRFESLKN